MKIRGIKIQDVYTGESESFDKYRMQGSTYSYFLMKKCRFQKHVLIDIERIHEEPLVVTTPLFVE